MFRDPFDSTAVGRVTVQQDLKLGFLDGQVAALLEQGRQEQGQMSQ